MRLECGKALCMERCDKASSVDWRVGEAESVARHCVWRCGYRQILYWRDVTRPPLVESIADAGCGTGITVTG